MSDLLVTAHELSGMSGEVRILDVRGEVAAQEPRYRAYPDRYRAGHIPGAAFADWRHDFTDRASAVPVTVASPEQFAADATRLGIAETTPVVAYDTYWNALAGRIVWVMRAYGHPARLLDGRFDAWLAAGLPVAEGDERPAPADPPHPVPEPPVGLLDLAAMRTAIDEGARPLDARSSAEFTGADTHARRAGHIPGARSIHYRRLLADDGTFLPPGQLRERLRQEGVDLDRPQIAYCNGGVS